MTLTPDPKVMGSVLHQLNLPVEYEKIVMKPEYYKSKLKKCDMCMKDASARLESFQHTGSTKGHKVRFKLTIPQPAPLLPNVLIIAFNVDRFFCALCFKYSVNSM